MAAWHSHLLPEAIPEIDQIVEKYDVEILVVRKRRTKYGDYRRGEDGRHKITINAGLHPSKFLLTLVHELAHMEVRETYGSRVLPHGKEWQASYCQMMRPFLTDQFFTEDLLLPLRMYFKKPKATTDSCAPLAKALRSLDKTEGMYFVNELSPGTEFYANNQQFQVIEKRRKRWLCKCISNGRTYLFHPFAEVSLC